MSGGVSAARGAAIFARDNFAREPYLQLATPTSMHVVWRTEGPIEPVLRYGSNDKDLNRTVRAEDMVLRIALGDENPLGNPDLLELRKPKYARHPKLHSARPGLVQYEAHIKELTPATRYYYAVYDGDKRLTPEDESYYFETHPLIGKPSPARFWVVGDSGVGREPQTSVHRSMVERVENDGRPLDFYVHVGDMAYSDGKDREFQTRFFEMYEPTLRNTVCWPAMGNHEGHTSQGTLGVGPYYDAYALPMRGESGGLPSGTEAYYSFDYGRIHFICLDSHDLDRKPSGSMARWLKADLERSQADWLIAFWHHPPYTKGSHDSDREHQLIEMRTHIMPILESAGVDLVLTGHSHIYERSMLMDGAYATPTVAEYVILDDGDGDPNGEGPYRKSSGLNPNEGTVQVVAGHGGANLSRRGTMPVMKRILLEHGSVIIDVDGDTLTGIMLNNEGAERDRFAMVKSGSVTPTRLANPRVLPPYTRPRSRDREDDGGQDIPEDQIVLIDRQTEWHYLAGGRHPASPQWKDFEYDSSDWRTGRAAFGYGYDRKSNVNLSDMEDLYTVVYLRRAFQVENAESAAPVGLVMDYDDAFIAYLNGEEVLRKGVRRGSGENAESIRDHEASGYRYYPIENGEKLLRTGRNILAIEGHNRSLGSSDFLLDPYLIMED